MPSNKSPQASKATTKGPDASQQTEKHHIINPSSQSPNHKKLRVNRVYSPPDHVGGGKKIFITIVKILKLDEENVFAVDFINPQTGNQAWMRPVQLLINEDPMLALDKYQIMAMLSRRDPVEPGLDLPLP